MVVVLSRRRLKCGEEEEKLTYWQRWYREHPKICIHVSREEYEFLKSLADSTKQSYRELLIGALRSLREFHDTMRVFLEREKRALSIVGSLPNDYYMKRLLLGKSVEDVCRGYAGSDFEFRLCKAVVEAIDRLLENEDVLSIIEKRKKKREEKPESESKWKSLDSEFSIWSKVYSRLR